jgi:hypothetical protein
LIFDTFVYNIISTKAPFIWTNHHQNILQIWIFLMDFNKNFSIWAIIISTEIHAQACSKPQIHVQGKNYTQGKIKG